VDAALVRVIAIAAFAQLQDEAAMSEVILHLTSDSGPDECRGVVGQLAVAFGREARD
jgi:hypothetical protein